MDYKALWERLVDELRNLIINQVKEVSPYVIMALMTLIEEVEILKHEQDNKGR